MTFLYGAMAWIMGIIPLLAAWVWWRQRNRGLARWVHPAVWNVTVNGFNQTWATRSRFGVWVAVVLLGIAVLRPQFGTVYAPVSGKGQSILIAIDASQSMDASDANPSRLGLVKQDIVTMLNQFSGDRVGLIGFSGVAAIQCPFTIDYPALKLLIGDLDTQTIPVPGTNLAEPIHNAIAAYRQVPGRKTLIIYSDGESFAGDYQKAASAAKAAGIVIHTIGVGSVAGSSIPIVTNGTPAGALKTNRQAEVVISRLNESALKSVATTTGGRYLRLTSTQASAPQLAVLLGKAGEADYRAYLTPVRQDRYLGLACLALILLAIDWGVSAYRRPKMGPK